MPNVELKIEYLDVNALTPYPKNTRKHTDKDVAEIVKSIDHYQFIDPIGIWGEHNTIVEGHGRLMAAKKKGLQKVPCIRLDHLTDEQRREYAIAHNRTAELSAWADNLWDELDALDMADFDFGFDELKDSGDLSDEGDGADSTADVDDVAPPMQHNVFENQDLMQFPCVGFYGIPEMGPSQTAGEKFLRFMDWQEVDDPENYIAHFYYDDYKFISAWREPDKYIDRLRRFKAVVAPDFSLYTDFPRALQILSCYRRQWCAAYWQHKGIDVIPDVVWGDKESFAYCFDGIPKHSVVAVSSVGVKRDSEWNNKAGDMFKAGFDEMMKRLQPTAVLFYGDMIDGLEGNIIRIPSYYEQKREYLNERKKNKWAEE